jgi:hypothetical protein
MDGEQMELLERLARLRELGAISRREFAREKESILRAPPRPAPVVLRAVPALAAGAAAPALVAAVEAPPRIGAPPRARPSGAALAERPLLGRIGQLAGWLMWTLFSVGGLDALLRHDALEALAFLVCGLLCAPPLHRLLALRMSSFPRLALTLLGVLLVLGIGAEPARASVPAQGAEASRAAVHACGAVVADAVGERGLRAREGIVRPWREFWHDLVWARVAGASLYDAWRGSRG